MSDLVHVTDSNFEAEVLRSELPVLVDFSAAWCGPCQRLQPILEELATEYAGRVKVAHVDIDQAQSTASKYSVMSVPTLKFIKSGEIVDQALGLMSKSDLASRIDKLL
jgi:thioredoxin 1